MPGKSERKQILNVCQTTEKSKEFKLKTYMCCTDYFKAFDTVK